MREKSLLKTRKRKIIIIVDNHVEATPRSYQNTLEKVSRLLELSCWVPGLENVTHLADNEISTLNKEDALIIWGGSNDVNRNEINV
jgi:hypothetical protein